MKSSLTPFAQFLKTIAQATNETQKREAFVALAAAGFADSGFAAKLALSAEYGVRFKSAGLVRRGAIDSFFGNLIIEFEFDLRKSLNHALEQLRNYVAGAWREDGTTNRPYLAVVSDGSEWRVFAPGLADPARGLDASNVTLTPIEAWERTNESDDPERLRFFLNRLFFRRFLLKPTTENFARDFGLTSPAFTHALAALSRKLVELRNDPQVTVYQKAWVEGLEISYGSIDADETLFAKHTYLAVLARLLVWAAFERRALDASELPDILSGLYFRGKKIGNLVEDDFFKWHGIPSPTDATNVWVALSHHLVGYDLSTVGEDILKPLYEQLVDPETRHVLGEYYTPDWLATRVVDTLLSGWKWDGQDVPAVLDPACGSGTFLRAIIEHMRSHKRLRGAPSSQLNVILSKVMGIDVHPLAVIISRATYVLAIRDLMAQTEEPINVPVFLANSLLMPPLQRDQSLFGESLNLKVDDRKYTVPVELLHDGSAYDATIEDVLSVARAYGNPKASLVDAPKSLRARLGDRLDKFDSSGELLAQFEKMVVHLAELIRDRRNSVHGFLLKNHYRPSMLRHTFDYVTGNPPWLTVGSVVTPEYKNLIIRLAAESEIAPRNTGDQSHTELATIFLVTCFQHFIRNTARTSGAVVALVMPRSVFTAKHHGNLRQGLYKVPFDVVALWDLDRVQPLFNIPSCVLFASRGEQRPNLPKDGFIVVGNLPRKEVSARDAAESLSFNATQFVLDFLGKRSAWRAASDNAPQSHADLKSQNAYNVRFRQGAILYPQSLLVVEAEEPVVTRKGTVRVRTSKAALENAKKVTAKVNHIVDAESLFFTAAGDHILTYTTPSSLWTVLLPVTSDPRDADFAPVDTDALRGRGLLNSAEWLDWAERQWAKVRKKGDKSPLYSRLDYLGQLSAQAEMKRFVVIYTAAAKRPVACVLDTESLALPFVARDRTYWASFSREEEAHYVCAFLNSDYAASEIVDWMNRGLFGPRDINKRVLDVPWPVFDPKNEQHVGLARVSAQLSVDAAALVPELPDSASGLQRRWLRMNLDSKHLKSVESFVKVIALQK